MLIEKLKEISNVKTATKTNKRNKLSAEKSTFSSLIDSDTQEKIANLGINDISALPFLNQLQAIMSKPEYDETIDKTLVEKSKNILLSLNNLQLSMLSIEKNIFDKRQSNERQKNIDALSMILKQMSSVKTQNKKLKEVISFIKTRAKVEIAKLQDNLS